MKKKIIATIAIIALSLFGLVLAPAKTYAATDICSQADVSPEIKKANGCSGDAATDLSNVIIGILNGVIGILGLVAVIFIIVGGVNYMSSMGDAGKIQKAKNTILYATIGLVIAVLSFAIVNFVITDILKNSGPSGDDDDDTTTTTTSIYYPNDKDPESYNC